MVARLTQTEAKNLILTAGFEPLEPYTNSITPWKCIHLACGQIRFPLLDKIRQGQSGCKDCSYKASAKKRLRSQSSAQEIAKNQNLLPLEEYKGAHRKWICKCLVCGAQVSPTLHSLIQAKWGCKECAKVKGGQARKITQEVAFDLLVANGFIPLPGEIFTNPGRSLLCTHLICGAEMKKSYSKVLGGDLRCVNCFGKRVSKLRTRPMDVTQNILRERFIELLEPEKYINSRFSVQFKCLICDYIWRTRFNHIFRGGGCPACSTYGFNPKKNAYLYLITNLELNAHKIGIAGVSKGKKNDRVYNHQMNGWVLFSKWDFSEGREAEQIELQILHKLRNELNIPPYLSKEEMPIGGWTETLSADAISLTKLKKLVEIIVND